MHVDRILREPEVRKLTGLSRTTRWRLARQQKFPKPIIIANRAVGWREVRDPELDGGA